MYFGLFTLFVALVIEIVGAYYSVTGLAAIFSGALIPILIMGASLEVGKVTAAVWLKLNWERASWTYKAYLVPAVAFLMVLTSMGIFGFLSKAHSDQNLVSGDSMAKVAIYDEKIKTEKENIEANRKALKQMDEGVDQVLGRSTDEKGADKAVAMRRSQQKERTRLQAEILQSQKSIAELSDARAPLAAEVRKVENEVGPIKYIAALLYGDNPDANILERAVRWVIILIVAVFDPLALVLILAAQQSLRWAKDEPVIESSAKEEVPQEEDRSVEITKDTQAEEIQTSEGEPDVPLVVNTAFKFVDFGEHPKDQFGYEEKEPEPVVEKSLFEQHPYLLQPFAHFENLTPMVATHPEEPKPEIYAGNPEDFQEPWPEEKRIKLVNAMQDFFNKNKELQEENLVNEVKAEIIPDPDLHVYDDERLVTPHDKKILAMGIDDIERPGDYLTPPEPELHYHPEGEYIYHDGKNFSIESFKAHFPDLAAFADNHPILNQPAKASFGNEFPTRPDKGDMFLRTDFLPSRQYKYNGSKWIEVEKATEVLAYDEQYIKHLVEKIGSGEYDVEELSETEQTQIAEYLKKSTEKDSE
jgi:hypothetical protein